MDAQMILEGLKKDLYIDVSFEHYFSNGSYSTQEYEQVNVLAVAHKGKECSYKLLARHQSMVRGHPVSAKEIMEEIEEAAWEVVDGEEADFELIDEHLKEYEI